MRRGSSTNRGEHLVVYGRKRCEDDDEQQGHGSTSPAQPASPMTPRTPSEGNKKPVMGKVKSKAKKWMHLLHKKKHVHAEAPWTPKACSAMDDGAEEEDAEYHGAPMYESERAPEVYKEASPRQQSPIPSPTTRKEPPLLFKVSSRFESEMKEANDMLRESKQLRVDTTKQKTVTFAPTIETTMIIDNERNGWSSEALSEAASEVLTVAFAAAYEAAFKMASKIKATAAGYEIDRKQILDNAILVKNYLMLKLEPGEDDRFLSEVITEAIRPWVDTWNESVEKRAVQRAKEVVSSWFLQKEGQGSPPVPLSTNPYAYADGGEFGAIGN